MYVENLLHTCTFGIRAMTKIWCFQYQFEQKNVLRFLLQLIKIWMAFEFRLTVEGM